MAKVPKAIDLSKISKRISELNIKPKVELEKLTAALKRYNPQGVHSIENIPKILKRACNLSNAMWAAFMVPRPICCGSNEMQ